MAQRIKQYTLSPVALLLWSAAIVLSYFTLDQKLALIFQQLQTSDLRHVAEFLTKFGYGLYYIVGLAVLFLFSRFVLKKSLLANRALFLLLALIVSGITCDIFKIILGRARPVQWFQNDLFGFYFFQTKANMWGFPSGHASTIAALMLGLCVIFPRYALAFVSFMLIIAFSRVMVTAHYLSDTIAGVLLGAATVLLLAWQFRKKNILITRRDI